MSSEYNISDLIQFHNAIDEFNYNLTVDWAIDLIQNGFETENVFMLASFSKPVVAIEIKPYISAVLDDLNLEEKEGERALFAYIEYHLRKIISDDSIKRNLNFLFEFYLTNNNLNDEDKFGLMPFYLLYHGWTELEDTGYNYYFEGADIDNIADVVKEQAKIWIKKHINGIKDVN